MPPIGSAYLQDDAALLTTVTGNPVSKGLTMQFILEQSINALQMGVTLFLVASGLTLVFGVMNIANMAHGSFYMLGAYSFRSVVSETGSYGLGLLAAATAGALVGALVEISIIRRLYGRSLLDQVIATFGLILVANAAVAVVWGVNSPPLKLPAWISHSVEITQGFSYPATRLAILVVGLVCALALFLVISKTRIGMLVRAGATHREFLPAFGVNIQSLYTAMFAGGAALAAIAGAVTSPVTPVQIGMGETILVPVLIVLVIGGMGSIRGALVAALLVAFADTFGRVYLPRVAGLMFSTDTAASVGASAAALSIFALMIGILLMRKV